jgi:hypothetical protein
MAVAPRDRAGQRRADGAVAIADRVVELAALAACDRFQRIGHDARGQSRRIARRVAELGAPAGPDSAPSASSGSSAGHAAAR